MSWLKRDLRLIGATAEEEFYEALSSTPCGLGGLRKLLGGLILNTVGSSALQAQG